MIIDATSDLHGQFPELKGGDLLIIAGDLTASDKTYEYLNFYEWLKNQKYRKKIIIAGNHDVQLHQRSFEFPPEDETIVYLCDSGTEFEGMKIWGSPWTTEFPNMNIHCKAFTKKTDEELKEKWDLIPCKQDILITHTPPLGIRDEVCKFSWCYWKNKISSFRSVGSRSLLKYLEDFPPKCHIFGHIHEGYGRERIIGSEGEYDSMNVCHMTKEYEPLNPPIRIIL